MNALADTLCFIPCSKSKTAAPDSEAGAPSLTRDRIPVTWPQLETGRNEMRSCIDRDGRPCRALWQYDGGFYNAEATLRGEIARGLRAGRLDLHVLSAGYGIVHALDPIRPYEAEMKGRVARMWRDVGLADAIAELIRTSRARRVFGFFAGPAHWSGAHAKYRYFFTEAVRAAASGDANLDVAACFYREHGQGTHAINGALGRALLHGLRADFSSRFLAEYAAGHADGNVVVRSKSLLESA